MYAIAIKMSINSSWHMEFRVYDDREKCDQIIEAMKLIFNPYRIKRIMFNSEL